MYAKLLTTPAIRVESRHASASRVSDGNNGSFENDDVFVEFGSSSELQAPPVAELRFRADRTGEGACRVDPGSTVLHQHIVCERGDAVVKAPADIAWTADSESAEETLTAERCDVEVMLDHFCRRVVGGLVPVADMSDLCQSVLLAQAIKESRRTGQPVSLGRNGG